MTDVLRYFVLSVLLGMAWVIDCLLVVIEWLVKMLRRMKGRAS